MRRDNNAILCETRDRRSPLAGNHAYRAKPIESDRGSRAKMMGALFPPPREVNVARITGREAARREQERIGKTGVADAEDISSGFGCGIFLESREGRAFAPRRAGQERGS